MTKDQLLHLSHALNSMEHYLASAERYYEATHLPIPSSLINIAGYLKTAKMIVEPALNEALLRQPQSDFEHHGG
ncbi:hypothetical protein LCGC14_2136230 [marine sediment metagenome]|uniref:Uncharacterized protein n=1 Tax=marine sediment metagenome TaxID=412755 RepID=A0A0F9EM57_9ZZZZ